LARFRLLSAILLPAFLGLLSACGADEATHGPGSWRETTEEALTEAQKHQRKIAFGAKTDLFRRLGTTLRQQIQQHGPAAAIDVCRVEAGALAARVAEERGLEIGRTSHRLRNPDNQPPAWAEDLVKEKREEITYLLHEDGRFAALAPIRLQIACLACHGKPETIDAKVRQKLAELYPEDEATGFAAGDLRGWFWMEVPAVRTAPVK
jgi:hypothetical protein